MAALVVFKWLFYFEQNWLFFFVIFVVNLKKFENIKWWILFVVSWNRNRNRNCHCSDKKQIFKLLGTSDSSVQTKKKEWVMNLLFESRIFGKKSGTYKCKRPYFCMNTFKYCTKIHNEIFFIHKGFNYFKAS